MKIKFDKVSKWFGEVIALNEVSFEFSNAITGLVGTNGAGKTTCIKLATSLIKPTLGNVTVDGDDIWHNQEFLKQMGFSPEADSLFLWMTGRQFLRWNCRFHGISSSASKKRVDEVLSIVGMNHAADRKIQGYSRGMRQRIKVGQALLNEPKVLFLDEPMAGTDPVGRGLVSDVIRDLAKEGTNVIVSSHVLHELERIVDKIVVLESGKLVAEGTIPGVRSALSRIPHRIRIRSNDSKKLGKMITDHVKGIQFEDDSNLVAEIKDRMNFNKELINLSKSTDIKIYEIYPLDEDLTTLYNLLKN